MQTYTNNAPNIQTALETVEFVNQCQPWKQKPTKSSERVEKSRITKQNELRRQSSDPRLKLDPNILLFVGNI